MVGGGLLFCAAISVLANIDLRFLRETATTTFIFNLQRLANDLPVSGILSECGSKL